MSRSLILVALVGLAPVPVLAQSVVDRAQAAGQAVGGPEHLMNEGTIGTIVLPYETSAPSEGAMSHVQFEDEISNVREQTDAQGRALRSTEDGYAVRPGVDIDGQGALFDDANWAHENADDVVGQYFSSETGTCETVALPVTDITDQFCSSSPAEVSETCDLVRRIWVDRFDTYRCDKRAASFIEVCERTNAYACHQASGQGGCLQQNVRFEGGDVTWNGDEATLHLAADPLNTSFLERHDFSVSVSDHFAPEEIRMIHIEAGGVSQLTTRHAPDAPLQVLETFYAGAVQGIGAGGYCPDSVTTGLIVPTHFTSGSECDTPSPSHAVGIYADVLQSGTDPSLRVFSLGYTVSTSGGHGFACQRTARPYACSQFQQLGTHRLTRTLTRWLDVPAPTHPVPGAAKKWGQLDLTLRVVGPPSAQGASLTFKFLGACCDSFVNAGSEQCE